MKYLIFSVATVGLAFLAQWFGLAALVFAIGHMWFETFVYAVLTLLSSGLGAIYGALLALEWLKDREESPNNSSVTPRIT